MCVCVRRCMCLVFGDGIQSVFVSDVQGQNGEALSYFPVNMSEHL